MSERSRIMGANEAQCAEGASRLRGDAARGRLGGTRALHARTWLPNQVTQVEERLSERETYNVLSAVIWPMSIGMVPLMPTGDPSISRPSIHLRECAA